MKETKEEVIKSIKNIQEPGELEKIHMFLIGMIAQQNIKQETT